MSGAAIGSSAALLTRTNNLRRPLALAWHVGRGYIGGRLGAEKNAKSRLAKERIERFSQVSEEQKEFTSNRQLAKMANRVARLDNKVQKTSAELGNAYMNPFKSTPSHIMNKLEAADEKATDKFLKGLSKYKDQIKSNLSKGSGNKRTSGLMKSFFKNWSL